MLIFPPSLPFQCHPASSATAYRQGKNPDCVLVFCPESNLDLRSYSLALSLSHTPAPSLPLARALTNMHVVVLSADRGMHRLLPVHAGAATLQKANDDQGGTFCASIFCSSCHAE